MLANSDVVVIFLIYGQFGAIRKADSGCIVCKTYIFNNNQKGKTELKSLQHSSCTIALIKGTIFVQNADFLQKKYREQQNEEDLET